MRSPNSVAIALAAALTLSALPALQATEDPKKAQLEKQMAEANKKLKEASKQVAELSKQLAELEGKKVRTFSFSVEERPRLGVLVQTDENPSTDPKGALLEGVTPGGPADEAGLKAGDIIVKLNGQKLAGAYAEADEDESAPGLRLIDVARELKAGQKATVEYLRGKETRTATITPRVLDDKMVFHGRDWDGDFDFDFEVPEVPEMPEDFIWINMPHNWLNMELVALNPELGEYFGTSEGLLVVECDKDSSLQLKPGDVLLKVGDRKAVSPSQVYRVLRTYESGESANLEIMRKHKRQTLSVKVPERHKSKVIKEKRHLEAPVPPAAPAPPVPPAPPSPPASAPRAQGCVHGESTQA